MKLAEIVRRLVATSRRNASGRRWPCPLSHSIALAASLAVLMPAAGQIQPDWTRTYNYGFATGLVLDGQSNICLLVVSSGDFATLKYSPDGTLLWTDRYDSSLQDTPTAIAADAAGQVWVTGISSTNGSSGNIVTIKYAADGTRLWVRSSDETNTLGYGYIAVTVDALGNSYVAGISGSSDPSLTDFCERPGRRNQFACTANRTSIRPNPSWSA